MSSWISDFSSDSDCDPVVVTASLLISSLTLALSDYKVCISANVQRPG